VLTHGRITAKEKEMRKDVTINFSAHSSLKHKGYPLVYLSLSVLSLPYPYLIVDLHRCAIILIIASFLFFFLLVSKLFLNFAADSGSPQG
jgi:hypothetical protein